MDADQRKNLEMYRANTAELNKFISYFFVMLMGSGLFGFFLLHLGADSFDWGLFNFSSGWLPRLAVIIPILLVTFFPAVFAYTAAKYLMERRRLGDLLLLIAVYLALALFFLTSAWLLSARLGYFIEVGMYGKVLIAGLFVYLIVRVIRMYAQATNKVLSQITASTVVENASALEKISKTIEIPLAVVLLVLLLAPLAVRLFQLITNK